MISKKLLKNAHYDSPESKVMFFVITLFVQTAAQNPELLNLPNIFKVKGETLLIRGPETKNIWHFCLLNDDPNC